jgi:Flp pilus assembly protein TadG
MNANLDSQNRVDRSKNSTAVALNPEAAAPKVEKLCQLCRKNRRGAAVVEFAIVAPVFFLLVFGMIEYGRMVMVQQVLTNAAREGARYAVIQTTNDTTAVTTKVKDYLTSGKLKASASTVTVTWPASGSSGSSQPVTVKVSIPFGQVSWLPSPMFLSSTTKLEASSVMRRESTN